MTNSELKTVLLKAGLRKEMISEFQYNFDVERISMVVEASSCPEIAFSAIHHIYPQLEVADLQKECESISSQFKAAWKKILIFAAIAVCSVIIGAASTGIGSGLIAGVIGGCF